MKQEDKRYLQDKLCHKRDKELLLKDLCARLPYGVKCKILETNELKILGSIQYDGENTLFDFWEDDQKIQYGHQLYLSEFKPYLFPLSSMTEEQKKEYCSLVWFNGLSRGWNSDDAIILDEVPMLTDFYHKNHIDYRGLIPKGLAIDATGLNIY